MIKMHPDMALKGGLPHVSAPEKAFMSCPGFGSKAGECTGKSNVQLCCNPDARNKDCEGCEEVGKLVQRLKTIMSNAS